jgi:hypothetical protein
MGASMKVHLTGMRWDNLCYMGPRRRHWQFSRGEVRTQRRACDQGNEKAERGDDYDRQPPPSSPRKIHSARNVSDETCVATPLNL